jgi:hypothetical protein
MLNFELVTFSGRAEQAGFPENEVDGGSSSANKRAEGAYH